MKQIHGKISFNVIPINKEDTYLIGDKNRYYLSLITEEQAAEFVVFCYPFDGQYVKIFTDYNRQCFGFKTAKESLISLLKANDVWIKEWLHDEYTMEEYRQKLLELPDDLLLIKL